MATQKAKAETAEISVKPLKRASVRLRIIGETPLFQNRMAEKAMQQLLVGGRKKTKADRAEIKHDPVAEFRSSVEMMDGGATALGLRVVAVKAAMATAALDTAGLTKASTQRLIFMPGDLTALYGTPKLRLDVVRSADIAKTPDVRSRAFFPKWGAEIEIQYIVPQLSAQSIVSLLCNAGILVGVGDYRQEKGKGAFGSFRVIGEGQQDAEWDELVANHGRAAQVAALEQPEYADKDTSDLMEFFFEERTRRAA